MIESVFEFLQTLWGTTFTASLAAIIVAALIMGRWRWKKKAASIGLATKVLKFLDGDADDDTRQMILHSKRLGDSLCASYKTKLAHDREDQDAALELIDKTLKSIKPLTAELTAADKELDDLKRAAIAFQDSLEGRKRTIMHLTEPYMMASMDAGHVRAQLLEVNVEPHEILEAAKGEAAIFLRGYGIGRLARFRCYRTAMKTHWPNFKESVAKEYRAALQRTSLHKAKK